MHRFTGFEESSHKRERSHGKTLRAAPNWEPEKAERFLSLEDLTALSAVSNHTSLEQAYPRPTPDENPALANTLTAALQKTQLSQAWAPAPQEL